MPLPLLILKTAVNHFSNRFPRWRKILAGSIVAIGAVSLLWKVHKRRVAKKKLERNMRNLGERKNRLLQKGGARADDLTQLSMVELQRKLEAGEVTPSVVLSAYQAKALAADRQTNCITELIVEADEIARQLDAQPRGERGPLYGIPMSLKEVIGVRGYDATYGMVSRMGRPASNDCVLVRVLRKQGAIPYVLTNISQLCMCMDCSNPLYGETVNPVRKEYTSGGSSGGEGALVGGRGSLLGFGTDVGGSVRIPAHFCGVCGLKPTAGRLSILGMDYPLYPPVGIIVDVLGPLARDVESLATVLRALCVEEMFRLDPAVAPLPFNEEVYGSERKLRIGYYETFDFLLEAVPSVRRAVRLAKRALETRGHTLVPFTPPDEARAVWKLAMPSHMDNGGREILRSLSFETLLVDRGVWWVLLPILVPRVFKQLLSLLIRPFNAPLADVVASFCGSGSIEETWSGIERVREYQRKFMEAWTDAALDGLIGPVMPIPAPPLGKTGDLCMGCAAYTMLYNLADVPAGVVPVDLVQPEDLTPGIYPMWDALHRKVWEVQADSVGLPLGVQCVAMRWQEELCLRIMREVELGLAAV